ncbi:FxLYD domain-containing protein [Halolamina sp. C58]|uniref:FxLYD domain-containing protein n=1 Tax=Halolamina sp. C58 TaxID=3421640 RepID=UPI003EB780A7
MNRKHVAIAVLVVVIALGGVAAALVTGFGPAPGGDEGSAGPSTPYENTVVVEDTEASGGDGGSDGSGGAAATEAPQPFTFVIEEITECGRTCRDVNGTITNQQDQTAEDVTVRSEIYTDGDMIWSGSSEAGDLAPGETFNDQKRVDLSYSEAYKVQQNDGQIVIRTYVETADATYVFKQTRTVA